MALPRLQAAGFAQFLPSEPAAPQGISQHGVGAPVVQRAREKKPQGGRARRKSQSLCVLTFEMTPPPHFCRVPVFRTESLGSAHTQGYDYQEAKVTGALLEAAYRRHHVCFDSSLFPQIILQRGQHRINR